jgi:hypothetical protein
MSSWPPVGLKDDPRFRGGPGLGVTLNEDFRQVDPRRRIGPMKSSA